MPSIAAKIRVRSRVGMRLSDFSTGFASRTDQRIFLSEFIESDVFPSLKRLPVAANRAQFRLSGYFLGQGSHPEIPLQRFGCKIRRIAILALGGAVYTAHDGVGKLNRIR